MYRPIYESAHTFSGLHDRQSHHMFWPLSENSYCISGLSSVMALEDCGTISVLRRPGHELLSPSH